jgi:hypothetical protein
LRDLQKLKTKQQENGKQASIQEEDSYSDTEIKKNEEKKIRKSEKDQKINKPVNKIERVREVLKDARKEIAKQQQITRLLAEFVTVLEE